MRAVVVIVIGVLLLALGVSSLAGRVTLLQWRAESLEAEMRATRERLDELETLCTKGTAHDP